jgi:hypothetical protein
MRDRGDVVYPNVVWRSEFPYRIAIDVARAKRSIQRADEEARGIHYQIYRSLLAGAMMLYSLGSFGPDLARATVLAIGSMALGAASAYAIRGSVVGLLGRGYRREDTARQIRAIGAEQSRLAIDWIRQDQRLDRAWSQAMAGARPKIG